MFIYINKYRYHWLSPYTILEKVFFWREIDYDEPVIERWSNRLNPFCVALQKFLDIVHPKIDYVKIDHWDTWGMDTTLAKIVLPMLKQLKATKHGSPQVDDEDVPETLRSTSAPTKENNWDVDDNFHERWAWVLDQMIWSFEQLCDPNSEDKFYSGDWDMTLEKSDRTYFNPTIGKEENAYRSTPGPNHTFKADYDGLKSHHDQIQRGLILFGKYYRGLWD